MFGAGAPFTPPRTSSFFIGNVVEYNSETGSASVLASGLQFPKMDAIGPDGKGRWDGGQRSLSVR